MNTMKSFIIVFFGIYSGSVYGDWFVNSTMLHTLYSQILEGTAVEAYPSITEDEGFSEVSATLQLMSDENKQAWLEIFKEYESVPSEIKEQEVFFLLKNQVLNQKLYGNISDEEFAGLKWVIEFIEAEQRRQGGRLFYIITGGGVLLTGIVVAVKKVNGALSLAAFVVPEVAVLRSQMEGRKLKNICSEEWAGSSLTCQKYYQNLL